MAASGQRRHLPELQAEDGTVAEMAAERYGLTDSLHQPLRQSRNSPHTPRLYGAGTAGEAVA